MIIMNNISNMTRGANIISKLGVFFGDGLKVGVFVPPLPFPRDGMRGHEHEPPKNGRKGEHI